MLQAISSWPAWYAAVMLGFLAVIAGLAAYDARRRRIPNAVVYPAILAATAVAFVNPTGPWYGFLAGGAVAAVALGSIAIMTHGGMGMGDAKLAGLIGLLAGWPNVIVALFVAFASGAVAGLGLIAAGRIERRQGIPFAPALLLGTVAAIVAGPRLLGAVLGWAGEP
jgi:prepilin signal peptidase PulO-like enzyme (type II secretory pathway)